VKISLFDDTPKQKLASLAFFNLESCLRPWAAREVDWRERQLTREFTVQLNFALVMMHP
jgi:hypothetical protein